MPQLGMFMMKGTIVHWLLPDGAAVKRGDALVEIQTEKVVHTIEASASGYLQRTAEEGQTLAIRGLIGYVLAEGEARAGLAIPTAASDSARTAPNSPRPAAGEIRASPIARKLAAEHGLDLATMTGTGPGRRIGERDVLAAIERRASTPAPKAAEVATTPVVAVETAAPSSPALQVLEGVSSHRISPTEGLYGMVFDRMAESHRTVARVTEFMQVDATAFVETRARLSAELKWAEGLSVSDNDLLIMWAARALREHRLLNGAFVDGAIRLQPEINIGLAVDTERGLLVPVVRRADSRGLADIVREVRALVERAHAGRCTMEDLSGGTFTITNLGMYEIDEFTPIVNLPECAVLGVGRIAPKAVVREGQIAIRQMMTLSLSFDHRIVDGAPAARFLQRLKQLMECPYLLLQ